ncbi:MAG: hypothetical protein WCJ08_08090 [bacterium]
MNTTTANPENNEPFNYFERVVDVPFRIYSDIELAELKILALSGELQPDDEPCAFCIWQEQIDYRQMPLVHQVEYVRRYSSHQTVADQP